MEKKFQFFRKLLLLTLLMLGVGSAFASNFNFWADNVSPNPPTTESIDGKTFYSITSAEELAWFALQTDHGANTKELGENINAILKNDIDLAGKIWTPICPGGGYSFFNGIFDGNGYSVKNMTIVSDSIYNFYLNERKYKKDLATKYVQNAAFIGTLGSGTVKNLTLKDISFYVTNGTSGTSQISVGALVGWKSAKGGSNGEIDFCSASGTIITSGVNQGVGGLVGNAHSSAIKNSISYVNIYASGDKAYVGGIVGLTKKTSVSIESCVYAGEDLVSSGNGGSVGAVAGITLDNGSVNPSNTYYNSDVGIGAVAGSSASGTTGSDNLNSENVVCVLNGGTWNETNSICEGAESEYWSEGLSGLSLNGSDGYKVTFVANGGSFASGAKTFKVLADGETITADEIASPTRSGKEFAGWATTADAAEPEDNLGVADASKKIYAVWYDFYTVSFKTGSETSFTDATFPDNKKIQTIQVAKHGMVSVEKFAVPSVYETAEHVKYYFTGWAFESKSFEAEDPITANDTLHLADLNITQNTVLYAVWTKAKTFSVTFNATLHGKTEVKFVKIMNEGDVVSEPSPDEIITEPGYRLVGWFTDENCTVGNEYNFSTPLTDNLTLYAKWEVADYTISYEMNGGTNAAGNPTTYNINSDDIVLATPTKEGASFDGWFYNYENDVFSNRATQISKGSSGDKTLYAKWTPIKYTIYYLSGSTIAKTIPSDEKEYGVNIQLKGAVEEFAHKGCVQDGWSTEDLGDKVFDVGATYDGNEGLMLYPHWVCQEFTISYEMYYGINHEDNVGKYQGPAAFTLMNPDPALNPEHYFENWYTKDDFKTSIRFIQDIDKGITVYARWYNNVTYQPGTRLDGTEAKNKTEKNYLNKTYTLKTSIDKYTLANYTLDGWSTTDGGDKVYDLGQVLPAEFQSNLTLYPHWTENREIVHQSGAVTVYQYATDGRKEAVIDGEYTGTDAVNIPNEIEVDTIIINRKFGAGVPSTIVLPFTLPVGATFNAKFYYLKNVVQNGTAWKATMKSIGTELPQANTPYSVICQGNDSLKFDLKGEKATLKTTELIPVAAAETDKWLFVGVYSYKVWQGNEEEITDGLAYGVAGQNSNGVPKGVFSKVSSGVKANPMRAYMRKKDKTVQLEPVAQTARAWGASYGLNNIGSEIIEVEFVDDEKTTAIGRMNTVTGEIKIDRWFDLKGRSVKNVNRAAKGAYYGKKGFHE